MMKNWSKQKLWQAANAEKFAGKNHSGTVPFVCKSLHSAKSDGTVHGLNRGQLCRMVQLSRFGIEGCYEYLT